MLQREFNLHSNQLGFNKTCNLINKSINNYNTLRPHASCDYLTPAQVRNKEGVLKKRWKNYNKKYNQSKMVALDF